MADLGIYDGMNESVSQKTNFGAEGGPVKTGPVSQAINHLNESINLLGKVIFELATHMDPMLGPDFPVDAPSEKMGETPDASKVNEAIQSMIRETNRMKRQINNLNDRFEL